MRYAKNDPLGRVLAASRTASWTARMGVVVATSEGVWIGTDCWITRDKGGGVMLQHCHSTKQELEFRAVVETALRVAGIEFLRGEDFELPEAKKGEKKAARGKTKKATRKTHENALDSAYAVLSERYEGVVRRRDTVWVDKRVYVKRLPKKTPLLVQFSDECECPWIDKLLRTLNSAGVTWKIGDSFKFDGEEPVVLDQATEDRRWLGRAGRDPHVTRCVLCKEVLDQCAVAEEGEYVDAVRTAIEEHAKAQPDGTPGVPSCQYSGCVTHDLNLPRDVAHAMIRLGGGDKPWEDSRGIKVSCIALVVRKKDHPEGFDMTRTDATRREFKELPDSAGDIYVRLGPKTCAVHVWIDPPYPSRHENAEDPATIDDVKAQYKNVDKLIDWCRKKYVDLRGLAEMDVQLDNG